MKFSSSPDDEASHGPGRGPWARLARRGALLGAAVLLLLGLPRLARATEPPRPEEATAPRVVVAIDPGVCELTTSSMQAALAGHLPGVTPDVQIRQVTGSEHATWVEAQLRGSNTRAVVWIERAEDAGVQIELRFPGGGSTWSRRLPGTVDPAVMLEQIGAVLSGMLMVEPEPPSAEDPASPSPPSEVMTPATPTRPWTIGLWLGYMGETLAPTSTWAHGTTLESALSSPRGWWVGLGLGWSFPQRVSAPGDVRVQRVPVQLTGGWRFREGRRFQPAVLVLTRAEALGWSPAQGDGVSGRGGWGARVALGAGVDGRIGVWDRLFVFVRATAQGWLLNSTIVVLEPSGARTILRAYPLSGTAVGGLGFAWAAP